MLPKGRQLRCIATLQVDFYIVPFCGGSTERNGDNYIYKGLYIFIKSICVILVRNVIVIFFR